MGLSGPQQASQQVRHGLLVADIDNVMLLTLSLGRC